MIETEQTVNIDAGIDSVWDFARDIRGWAGLMPGMRECDVVDDDNSRWTLKVGVGGLVRTVRVQVHVDQWDGPGRALFSYKLEGDPVKGGGSYAAVRKGPTETEVTLQVRVEGAGPMAPMWEAMGKPLLPQLARGFAEQLKASIEEALGPAAAPASAPAKPRGIAALIRWLRGLWRHQDGASRAEKTRRARIQT
jgi:carbon monoxide dehydrogenase subunit G